MTQFINFINLIYKMKKSDPRSVINRAREWRSFYPFGQKQRASFRFWPEAKITPAKITFSPT